VLPPEEEDKEKKKWKQGEKVWLFAQAGKPPLDGIEAL